MVPIRIGLNNIIIIFLKKTRKKNFILEIMGFYVIGFVELKNLPPGLIKFILLHVDKNLIG